MITKIKSALLVLAFGIAMTACGSGSSPVLGTNPIPGVPTDLPPILPDFQGGQIQFSAGYQIKGTLNDLVEPQVTKSGYVIYGGVQ